MGHGLQNDKVTHKGHAHNFRPGNWSIFVQNLTMWSLCLNLTKVVRLDVTQGAQALRVAHRC